MGGYPLQLSFSIFVLRLGWLARVGVVVYVTMDGMRVVGRGGLKGGWGVAWVGGSLLGYVAK